MIRDISKEEKIEYSQKAIDDPKSLFWFWCFAPDNLFDDISYYLDNSPAHMSRRAIIAGILCGLIVVPALIITYILCQIVGGFGYWSSSMSNKMAQGIILSVFLLPSFILIAPFSIYTFYILKKNALIYLITSD